MADKIYSTVLQYLRENFSAPYYLNTNEYEVGTVLFTADPYNRSNATIIKVLIEDSMYQVLTDIGNVIDQSKLELKQKYLPPVCKRTNDSSEDNLKNYYKYNSSYEPNVNKDHLIERAKYIIDFYGQPTVASDFAKEVLDFLQNNNFQILNIPKPLGTKVSEFEISLRLEDCGQLKP